MKKETKTKSKKSLQKFTEIESLNTVEETKKFLAENPDFERREIFQWIDHPTLGRVKMLAWPVKMYGNNVSLEAAPLLGQHTETVLSEWLGLSPEKIQELSHDGVI